MKQIGKVDEREEWFGQVPRSIRKQAIFGVTLMAVALGGFGAWAFKAPLAAAVISQGTFVANGENKIVQHLEGGIIKTIAIKEGDEVAEGQLLVRLDETTAHANERELQLRQYRLEATESRLMAEYAETAKLTFPPHLEDARSDFEVASILNSQALSFGVSRRAIEQDLTLLNRNSEALEIRKAGYSKQLSSHHKQVEILTGDYAAKSTLLAKGLTRRTEVTALQRLIIEAEGQIGRLQAEIDEIAQIQRKYETEIAKARSAYRQAALDELQTIQAELESIREKSRKARNFSRRSKVVAPVAGTVVRLHYHTAGGVVESGKPIAEILPAGAPLIIEMQIPRTEIDSVRVGQHAAVQLTALNRRTTPVLDGEVFYVSADAIANRSSGAVRDVYVARVSLDPSEMRRVPGFAPTPGMPAQIMIQTAERTFAQYLAKPIVDSMSRAFREQ